MDIRLKDSIKRVLWRVGVLDIFLLLFFGLSVANLSSRSYRNIEYYISSQLNLSYVEAIKTVMFENSQKYVDKVMEIQSEKLEPIFSSTTENLKKELTSINMNTYEGRKTLLEYYKNHYDESTGIVLVDNLNSLVSTNEPYILDANKYNDFWTEGLHKTSDGKAIALEVEFNMNFRFVSKSNNDTIKIYLQNNYVLKELEVNKDIKAYLFKVKVVVPNAYIFSKTKSNIKLLIIEAIIFVVLVVKLLINIFKYTLKKTLTDIKEDIFIEGVKKYFKWILNKGSLFKFGEYLVLNIINLVCICLVIYNMFSGNWISIDNITPIIPILISMFIMVMLCIKAYGLYKLESIVEEMSVGNFDDVIIKDLYGIQSIVNKLNRVKYGYREAIEKSVQNEKLKTELISNVSHDLRTPLTSIINYVDILKGQDLTDEEKRDCLNILDNKSKRLKVLIDDLFEVSKMNSGKIDLDIQKVDVIELLYQILGEYDDACEEKGLTYKVNAPENIILDLDGCRMARVFSNVMSNACKYSLENTRIYVEVEESINDVRISFKNISKFELDFDNKEILERFVRGDKSRNSELEGSGLGLAISKGIVELHGSEIKIKTEGDLFKVYIILKK